MPHPWDQIDSDLCSGNVGPQCELTGGLKNLLSNIGDNGGPNHGNMRQALWPFAVWATKNGSLGERALFPKVGANSAQKNPGAGLPTTGWNIQAILCGDGDDRSQARIPLSETRSMPAGAWSAMRNPFWEIDP